MARTALLAALVLVPAAACAQPPPDFGRQQLQAFIGSPTHEALIGRALDSLSPAVFPRCPGLVSNGSQVTIMRPLSFAAGGAPTDGAWREAYPVSGCGNDTTVNLFFAATDGKVNTVIGMPGTTRADPTLQHDALPYAVLGATAAARSCRQFVVRDTSYDGPQPREAPGPGTRPPWRETWAMLGCGRTFAVPLDFVPDATGTTIAQPGGVTER